MEVEADTPSNADLQTPPRSDRSIERSPSERLREQLRANWNAAEERDAGERRTETRDSLRKDFEADTETSLRAGRAKAKRLSATENELASIQRGDAPDQDTSAAPETPKSAAPTAWAKDARETWEQLPEPAKAAILKREADTEKGVQQLKNQYAGVDQKFANYFDPGLRQHGQTREQFLDSIAGYIIGFSGKNPNVTPAQAVARLAQGYGINPNDVFAAMQAMPAQPQQTQQQYRDPRVDHLMQEAEARTQQQNAQVLANFAKDHPHLEKVRVTMGHLLSPNPVTGEAMVPMKDGALDLNTAYEMACQLVPEVKQEIDVQKQLEKQAKQREAAAARAKAGNASIPSNRSPGGAPTGIRQQAPKRGKGVRESIMDAISEYRA